MLQFLCADCQVGIFVGTHRSDEGMNTVYRQVLRSLVFRKFLLTTSI